MVASAGPDSSASTSGAAGSAEDGAEEEQKREQDREAFAREAGLEFPSREVMHIRLERLVIELTK